MIQVKPPLEHAMPYFPVVSMGILEKITQRIRNFFHDCSYSYLQIQLFFVCVHIRANMKTERMLQPCKKQLDHLGWEG